MSFGTAIATGFRKYADFTGVASRSEFWWFNLFLVLGSFVFGALGDAFGAVWFFCHPPALPRRWSSPSARRRSCVGFDFYRTCCGLGNHRDGRAVVAADENADRRGLTHPSTGCSVAEHKSCVSVVP